MWDEEDEKLMCKALGYHGDDVCPECGYETCHCDDIYEMSLRSYKCVCKKCGKEFIITSQGQPSVNFCDDCHYEAITVCKKCGKEVNVNIISPKRILVNNKTGMMVAKIIIKPPIVGVPSFCFCPSRPRSLTNSPICFFLRKLMIFLPYAKAIISENKTAIAARNEMYLNKFIPGT